MHWILVLNYCTELFWAVWYRKLFYTALCCSVLLCFIVDSFVVPHSKILCHSLHRWCPRATRPLWPLLTPTDLIQATAFPSFPPRLLSPSPFFCYIPFFLISSIPLFSSHFIFHTIFRRKNRKAMPLTLLYPSPAPTGKEKELCCLVLLGAEEGQPCMRR